MTLSLRPRLGLWAVDRYLRCLRACESERRDSLSLSLFIFDQTVCLTDGT